MTTLEHDLDRELVDWGALWPKCEVEGCENDARVVCEHRHLHPANCDQERRPYFICEDCYEYIKHASTACVKCGVWASVFKI